MMMYKELFPYSVYFVSGIDTDAGKTVATAYISRTLLKEGVEVITQKLIQTGCEGISEDILAHRKIEGRELTDEDRDSITCPLVYSYPCSPHMATAIDHREPDFGLARRSTEQLLERYEKVLIEGAGGLMVPLTEEYLTIDYIEEERLPVVLVTTAKLGSINHTLLSLEVLLKRSIEVAAVVYNQGIATDPSITVESERYLRLWLSRHAPSTPLLPLPHLTDL